MESWRKSTCSPATSRATLTWRCRCWFDPWTWLQRCCVIAGCRSPRTSSQWATTRARSSATNGATNSTASSLDGNSTWAQLLPIRRSAIRMDKCDQRFNIIGASVRREPDLQCPQETRVGKHMHNTHARSVSLSPCVSVSVCAC